MPFMKKCFILFFLCLLLSGVSDLSARGTSTKGMTAEQLSRLAVDIHEINNLMSLHAWYHSALMHDVEVAEIWSKREDIVLWFEQSGYFKGPKAIKEDYGRSVDREKTKGFFTWHTITTPVVEVAADGETAKGIWYTPGVAGCFKDGKSNFNWMFEKYGVDFIREDGVWKIWHMHVYSDTGWSLGETIAADGSMAGVAEALKAIHGLGTVPETPASDNKAASAGDAEKADAEKKYKQLSPTTELELRPRPPVPYKTWSETWSYADPGE